MNEVPEDVEIETIWVVDVPYTPEAQERRPPLRRAHLTRIARLIREGRIVEAGGTADFTKAVLLIRAETEAEALALIEEDVYTSGWRLALPCRPGVRAGHPAPGDLGVDSRASPLPRPESR